MPNIQYDQTQPTQQFVAKKKLVFPRLGIGSLGKKILLLVVLTGVIYLSAILAGLISALSSNVTVTALSIVFDPQITIAYILTYYFLSHFYDLTRPQMYNFFVLTLLLSFTIPYMNGAITLMLLPPILRKLHLIARPELKS